MAGCCFLRSEPASAQDAAPAYAYPKQFSADVVTTIKDGRAFESKMYMESGKLRTDMNANGMSRSLIVRPDQKKIYQVMVDRKMMIEIPIDPEKYKKAMGPFGPEEKFEWVGPDTVDGVAATKYKMTTGEGNVTFLWIDAARQFPVKIASEDGAYTILWKNFQAGPQDAALFEPPSGYQVINAPAVPSASPPGGG